MTVAGKKALQAKHVALTGPADDDRPRARGLDQPHPTQDEGAHDPLAQFGLRDQQSPQPFRRNDDGLHGTFRVGVDE